MRRKAKLTIRCVPDKRERALPRKEEKVEVVEHSIPLAKGRIFSIITPLEVTRRELERISRWLSLQLLIKEDNKC